MSPITIPEKLVGPIRISLNGRYFIDAQQRPFFWMADTAWPLFTQYSHDDTVSYLRDRASKGFTVIQGVLAWGPPEPGNFHGTKPRPNYAGEFPWEKTRAKPNPAFFEHVDHLLSIAEDLGLILAILPTWGAQVNNFKLFDEASAHAYGKWLGQRYAHQRNLIWINGGDREPVGFENVWRALAMGLREGDAGRHLITYHPCGWRSSSYYFHDEPWLDFNMIETWTAWPQTYASVAADYQLVPAKPVVMGEGAYENGQEYPLGPITPLIIRRQAWWTFMAGGFVTYGQVQMWRVEPNWTSTFSTPGALQMGHFKTIANSRPWWKMIPDQTLFNANIGSERTLNTSLRALDRTCAMLYISSQCHVRVNLDRIATPQVKATWVNPANGETKDAGKYPTGNHVPETFPTWTSRWFVVPDRWEDGVLILDGCEE